MEWFGLANWMLICFQVLYALGWLIIVPGAGLGAPFAGRCSIDGKSGRYGIYFVVLRASGCCVWRCTCGVGLVSVG